MTEPHPDSPHNPNSGSGCGEKKSGAYFYSITPVKVRQTVTGGEQMARRLAPAHQSGHAETVATTVRDTEFESSDETADYCF